MTADPAVWRRVNRALLAKALGEWCYEGLLTPERRGDRYAVALGDVRYEFAAEPEAFGWLRVDPDSAVRYGAGLLGNQVAEPAWDVRRLLVDAAGTIGVDPATTAAYLGELSATLAADARLAAGPPVSDLLALDHADVEGHLTGHPWLVANKGRIGFTATDLRRYAPESRRRLRLRWIAVHRGLAEFRGVPGLSEHQVRLAELGPDVVAAFGRRLTDAGLDPDSYVWFPVHPWQWDRVVRVEYAGELAERRIVSLGEPPDEYLPQQSIRTLTNMTERRRYDVKLPLSIMNTSVWRGIPPHCAAGAPVLTSWLAGLLGRDPHLADAALLGEVASVTVRHPYLSVVDGVPYRHLETLGCIWRTPVSEVLHDGEHARPLSALLHVDGAGDAVVASLVRASGRTAADWLATLFDVLLGPLAYLLYRYGLTFNPHGQNALLAYGPDETPARLLLKDFIDDVELSATVVPEREPAPLGLVPRKPPGLIAQHVVDSVLVGHLRYLAPLCAEHLGVPRDRFWGLARAAILATQQRFPDLADRFGEYDLLAPTFPRFRLNADRLVVTGYGDQPIRHAIGALGTVPNPVHLAEPGRTTPASGVAAR